MGVALRCVLLVYFCWNACVVLPSRDSRLPRAQPPLQGASALPRKTGRPPILTPRARAGTRSGCTPSRSTAWSSTSSTPGSTTGPPSISPSTAWTSSSSVCQSCTRLRAWLILKRAADAQVVRLHVVVPAGPAGRHDHLPRHAGALSPRCRSPASSCASLTVPIVPVLPRRSRQWRCGMRSTRSGWRSR